MRSPKKSLESVRLDKWLWVARFAKTRTKACELCTGKKIKVNRTQGKPSREVKIGDTISMHLRGEYRSFEVVGIARRPLPAIEARKLYVDSTPQKKPKEIDALLAIAQQMERESPPRKGRPTKRERRDLDRVRRFGK